MKTVHVLPTCEHSSLSLRPLVDPPTCATGSENLETRYVADLALRPGDMVWLFACLPGDVWIAARVPWER